MIIAKTIQKIALDLLLIPIDTNLKR